MPPVQAHMTITGTPDLGADGKDYRANSVHAPFPKNQHPSPREGAWFGGGQPTKHRLRCNPRGTMMNANFNPQAAAEQARQNYRDATAQLGLNTSIPESRIGLAMVIGWILIASGLAYYWAHISLR